MSIAIVSENGINDGKPFDVAGVEGNFPEAFGLRTDEAHCPGAVPAGTNRFYAHRLVKERTDYDTTLAYLIIYRCHRSQLSRHRLDGCQRLKQGRLITNLL